MNQTVFRHYHTVETKRAKLLADYMKGVFLSCNNNHTSWNHRAATFQDCGVCISLCGEEFGGCPTACGLLWHHAGSRPQEHRIEAGDSGVPALGCFGDIASEAQAQTCRWLVCLWSKASFVQRFRPWMAWTHHAKVQWRVKWKDSASGDESRIWSRVPTSWEW